VNFEDAVGNTVLITDVEGFQTHYRYDNLNRPIDEYQDFGEGRTPALTLTPAMIASYPLCSFRQPQYS
jgi:YD repeat-containing protein